MEGKNLEESVTDSAKCANFIQKFKSMLLEESNVFYRQDGHTSRLLPNESTLNEIAMKLYDYARK